MYKLHFTSVYRFFYYKSVNTSEIEDLVHDVFMRFYTKYSQETFDEDEAKKILYGYARNIYKEWVRARIKEKKSDFNDDIDYSDSFDSLPGKEFEEKLKSQRLQVQEALKLLNPKVKAVSTYLRNRPRITITAFFSLVRRVVFPRESLNA